MCLKYKEFTDLEKELKSYQGEGWWGGWDGHQGEGWWTGWDGYVYTVMFKIDN